MSDSPLEAQFAFYLEHLAPDIPTPVREFKFHPTRKFKIDFAFIRERLAVEIDGGTYSRGRHVRPEGYRRDCEKGNLLTLNGWRTLRFTSDMLDDPQAVIETVRKALAA